jgi:hypothetical protein
VKNKIGIPITNLCSGMEARRSLSKRGGPDLPTILFKFRGKLARLDVDSNETSDYLTF